MEAIGLGLQAIGKSIGTCARIYRGHWLQDISDLYGQGRS